MGTTPISIVVTDGIDPSIAPNLKAISVSARDADASLQSLSQALNSLQNSGLSNLSRSISAASNSTTKLAQATGQLGAAAITASQNVDKLAISYTNLNIALSQSIGLLNTYGNVIRTANTATFQMGVAGKSAGDGATTARIAMQTLEGSAMGAARGAGIFLATTLKLGPALQAAFPIIGALALIEILAQMYQGVMKVVQAYKDMGSAATNAAVDAILAGEKIIKAKPQTGFSEGIAKLVAGDFSGYSDLTIVNTQTQLKNLMQQRVELTAQLRAQEQGLQGDALAQKRIIDLQKERDLVQQQIATVNELTLKLDAQAKAAHNVETITQIGGSSQFGGANYTSGIASFSDLSENQKTQVNQQLKDARVAVDDLNSEFRILGFNIQGAMNKEPIAAAKDELKAAHAQLKAFNDELANAQIKANQQGNVFSPTDKLAVLQSQAQRALPQNQTEINAKIATTTQQITRQADALENLFTKYADEAQGIGLYSDALKINSDLSKIQLQLNKEGIELDVQQTAAIKDLVSYVRTHADYQRELKSIYDQFEQPLRNYEAGIQAVAKLEYDQAITHAQGVIALNELKLKYQDSINPLNEYNHQLDNQQALFGKFGTELTIATDLQNIQEQLRKQGITDLHITLPLYEQRLRQMEQEKQLQNELNKIYNETHQALINITTQQRAWIAAKEKGLITSEKEQTELAKLRVQLAQVNIDMGKATSGDVLAKVFGDYTKQFKGFTNEVTSLWANTFSTLANGAADALGRAIAFGENLGDALKNVARQALAELISGMIKLGIQMLITHFLGQALAAAAITATSAEAAAVATAWAPAAAFASLATLGTNAGPAAIALTTTTALSEVLAQVSHFANGGIVPGFGSTDSVPAMLMPGEFVLKQSAVKAIGLSTLHAFNSGNYNQSSSTMLAAGGSTKINVNIVHDGSTNVTATQIDDTTIRIIAQQEAIRTVDARTPNVIAAELQNPNSRSSKAMVRNNELRRRRD